MMYEATTETTGYRGYIGSRQYASGEYTQSVQNLLIRTYCQRNAMTYLLSATEYAMPRCYMMLEEVVNSVNELEGIVLFSIFMLPESPSRRQMIYRKILSAGKSLHAALEDLSIHSEADIQKVEDLLMMHHIVMDETVLREFVDGSRQVASVACG